MHIDLAKVDLLREPLCQVCRDRLAKLAELIELGRHLEVLERRSEEEKDPHTRASWDDQHIAIQAMFKALRRHDP